MPVVAQVNPRARRITLRIDNADGGVRLTLPRGVSLAEGMLFAREKAAWLRDGLAALPPRVPFADGTLVPVLGTDHRIRHLPGGRGTVRRQDGEIRVTGQARLVARRVETWLRAEARRELGGRARLKAARIGRRVARVAVRETRSRWGSASDDGNLNFCWRLVLAPEAVLDYVVAHEVAHLEVMNHGPRFWRLVGRLTADVDGPRAWLLRHGARLYRYG